ncbi:MAG TPA: hypothetical protein VKB89_08465 [Xanthobacteraceae bacterium]|nr:hypothetical protein [Xanthobacteraceae bacterium]
MTTPARDGQHPIAQTHQPADDIAANVQPHDQNRPDQTQDRERQQDACTEPLNRERSSGRGIDFSRGLRHQAIDGPGEAHGQIGVFRNQLFSIADQIELLAAQHEYGIGSNREGANTRQLLDEDGAQFRIEIFRFRIEIIEGATQLETDHREARLFADGCGLHQLVDNGREAALRSLRRAVENDRCGELAPSLRTGLGTLLACLVERAADLHFHDLKPWREQPLRLFIDLEHRLQQSGEALPGLESQPHQIFQFQQVGSERGGQQLDRNRRLACRADAASDIGQSDDEAIDLRPHPVRYFIVFLRCRGGEQGGSGRDQPVRRARDFHRADDLRHAGIDHLQPIADLAKRVDARGRGQHSEAADAEEGEQQARANSEIQAPRCRSVSLFCI